MEDPRGPFFFGTPNKAQLFQLDSDYVLEFIAWEHLKGRRNTRQKSTTIEAIAT
jgi:hypothetical protein